MMATQNFEPAPISKIDRLRSGVDDVREQHGRQHAIDLSLVPNLGRELADPLDDVVARQSEMIARTEGLSQNACRLFDSIFSGNSCSTHIVPTAGEAR